MINMNRIDVMKQLTKHHNFNAHENEKIAKSLSALTIFFPLFSIIIFVIVPLLIVAF